jgi:tetratricopeptide (TPR) repeat protein
MTTTKQLPILALAGLLVATACAPKRVHQEPILENDDRVPEADVQGTAVTAANQQVDQQAARDSIAAAALATCAGDLCAAVTRGELALGMNETQVLAATRTTYDAWTIRRADGAAVLVPRSLRNAPHDATGEVAMVQVDGGRVTSYSYREPQGVRVVSTPADATTAGRAAAMADQLIREGDDYAARGEFTMALNRYDRAQILKPEDPMITYRIATSLDKMLRPREAEIQYRLFLHRLELEKIEALGQAYANIAQAIAYAKERVIVLEQRNP